MSLKASLLPSQGLTNIHIIPTQPGELRNRCYFAAMERRCREKNPLCLVIPQSFFTGSGFLQGLILPTCTEDEGDIVRLKTIQAPTARIQPIRCVLELFKKSALTESIDIDEIRQNLAHIVKYQPDILGTELIKHSVSLDKLKEFIEVIKYVVDFNGSRNIKFSSLGTKYEYICPKALGKALVKASTPLGNPPFYFSRLVPSRCQTLKLFCETFDNRLLEIPIDSLGEALVQVSLYYETLDLFIKNFRSRLSEISPNFLKQSFINSFSCRFSFRLFKEKINYMPAEMSADDLGRALINASSNYQTLHLFQSMFNSRLREVPICDVRRAFINAFSSRQGFALFNEIFSYRPEEISIDDLGRTLVNASSDRETLNSFRQIFRDQIQRISINDLAKALKNASSKIEILHLFREIFAQNPNLNRISADDLADALKNFLLSLDSSLKSNEGLTFFLEMFMGNPHLKLISHDLLGSLMDYASRYRENLVLFREIFNNRVHEISLSHIGVALKSASKCIETLNFFNTMFQGRLSEISMDHIGTALKEASNRIETFDLFTKIFDASLFQISSYHLGQVLINLKTIETLSFFFQKLEARLSDINPSDLETIFRCRSSDTAILNLLYERFRESHNLKEITASGINNIFFDLARKKEAFSIFINTFHDRLAEVSLDYLGKVLVLINDRETLALLIDTFKERVHLQNIASYLINAAEIHFRRLRERSPDLYHLFSRTFIEDSETKRMRHS
jgi:hypothetical protein